MKNEISPTIIQTEEKLVAAKKNKAAPPKIREKIFVILSEESSIDNKDKLKISPEKIAKSFHPPIKLTGKNLTKEEDGPAIMSTMATRATMAKENPNHLYSWSVFFWSLKKTEERNIEMNKSRAEPAVPISKPLAKKEERIDGEKRAESRK